MRTITKPSDCGTLRHVPLHVPPRGSQAWEQLWVSAMEDADAASLPPVTNWAGVPSAQWCRGDGHSSYLGLLTFLPLLTTSPLAFAGGRTQRSPDPGHHASPARQSQPSHAPRQGQRSRAAAWARRAAFCRHRALGTTSQLILVQRAVSVSQGMTMFHLSLCPPPAGALPSRPPPAHGAPVTAPLVLGACPAAGCWGGTPAQPGTVPLVLHPLDPPCLH